MTTLKPEWYVPSEGNIVQLTLLGALELAALKYNEDNQYINN